MKENKHPRKILYICDWLPPDFGATGQYSALFARRYAEEGNDVILAGLSSTGASTTTENIGRGRLTVIKLHARKYDKTRALQRMLWTAKVNTRLAFRLLPHMRRVDEIIFTGSPPLFLHWIAPLNILLRKHLVYRITDFHPECLMATMPSVPFWLNLLYRMTIFWRRRIAEFEVLGQDQMARLEEIGIPRSRMRLKRDPSPVHISPDTQPLPRPVSDEGKFLLLYSGNWGVAHDYQTFVKAYERHHREGSGRMLLWLNATGMNAEEVEAALKRSNLPFIRSQPVPLEDLASLLVTPDAHLITLKDAFVGYVMPSKVYGCIESGRPVLFIGSKDSDVHLLCTERSSAPYFRVDVGDVDACAETLEKLADMIAVDHGEHA